MNKNRENQRIVNEGFWAKVRKVGKKVPFLRDVFALYDYVRDPSVHWARKSVALGALAYFISPLDAIPDLTPIVGYLDDTGVIAAAVAYYQGEIEEYY